MSPGFRHVEKGILPRYADSIEVRTFPSGERRIGRPPPKELLEDAFAVLGTQAGVAGAFGVTRFTVKRWARKYAIQPISRPEAGLASTMRQRLGDDRDKCKVAQWVMDEGSVSVAHFVRGDYTILLVCGSMNDYGVLSSISHILDTPITSSRAPGPTTLPMGAIRVQSARAYALLETILPYMVGLKANEAVAALKFFPSSGLLRGRHTTDEFLLPVWEHYSLDVLNRWNERRRVKITQDEVLARAQKWTEGRVKRARRFVASEADSVHLSQRPLAVLP